jgi:hypothetical protein
MSKPRIASSAYLQTLSYCISSKQRVIVRQKRNGYVLKTLYDGSLTVEANLENNSILDNLYQQKVNGISTEGGALIIDVDI